MRYRVIFATTPSGGYAEFSGNTDAAAIAHARYMATVYGDIVDLTERGGSMVRPIDFVDIPDETEPEHNIPDAVCDAQTPLGGLLDRRVAQWLTERSRLNVVENSGTFPPADEWHASDDDAADIVNLIAVKFGITGQLPPPRAEDALTYDDCFDHGVDGSLRFFGEEWDEMVRQAGSDEGPCCSICDALGHGYPGGGPCPLEERGFDDARQDEERF